MYFNLLYFISKHFQFIVVIGIAAIFLVAISIGIILFVKFHRQKDWIDYANDCVLDYLCENETDFQDDKTQEPRMNIRFLNNRLSELINRINKETTDHEQQHEALMKELNKPKEATLKLNEEVYNKLKEILINNNEPILKALSESNQALINSINGSFGNLHKKINFGKTTCFGINVGG